MRNPGGTPGLLMLWNRDERSVFDHECQLHVDAEMLDRSVFSQYDLLFRDPGPSNVVDGLLRLGDALSDSVFEATRGRGGDLNYLRNRHKPAPLVADSQQFTQLVNRTYVR